MANKRPSNGFDKNVERAKAAGHKSSRALPREIKEARLMNATVFEECVYKYMDLTLDELVEVQARGGLTLREEIVASILVSAAEKGDVIKTEFLLNRTIGKVADKVDHTMRMRPSIIVKTDGTRVEFTKTPIDPSEEG